MYLFKLNRLSQFAFVVHSWTIFFMLEKACVLAKCSAFSIEKMCLFLSHLLYHIALILSPFVFLMSELTMWEASRWAVFF